MFYNPSFEIQSGDQSREENTHEFGLFKVQKLEGQSDLLFLTLRLQRFHDGILAEPV